MQTLHEELLCSCSPHASRLVGMRRRHLVYNANIQHNALGKRFIAHFLFAEDMKPWPLWAVSRCWSHRIVVMGILRPYLGTNTRYFYEETPTDNTYTRRRKYLHILWLRAVYRHLDHTCKHLDSNKLWISKYRKEANAAPEQTSMDVMRNLCYQYMSNES